MAKTLHDIETAFINGLCSARGATPIIKTQIVSPKNDQSFSCECYEHKTQLKCTDIQFISCRFLRLILYVLS